MKRILYPIMLFIIIGQSAIAQCVNRYKQKIVLAYYKTIQCNSDMERNYRLKKKQSGIIMRTRFLIYQRIH